MKEFMIPTSRLGALIRKHSPCAFTILLILIIIVLTGALYYVILEYSSHLEECPHHQSTTSLSENSLPPTME